MEETDIEIRAYLSYRRSESEKADRGLLFKACEDCGIKLIYDEIGTKENESFIDFMNHDVIGARFVIAFLTPEYFSKPYTLHELLELDKDINATQRLQFSPVRKTKEMVSTLITDIRKGWGEKDSPKVDRKTKNMLAELQNPELKISKSSEEDLRQIYTDLGLRIENAWNRLVKPQLTRVMQEADAAENRIQFYEAVAEKIKQDAKVARQQAEDTLKEKIEQQLGLILQKNPGFLQLVVNDDDLELDQSAGHEQVAKKLIEQGAYQAIITLGRILQSQEEIDLGNRDASRWLNYCDTAKKMCGWLLLLSIDPDWWVHNYFYLADKLQNGIHSSIKLAKTDHSYSEVIVSRTMLSQANFKLDKNGDKLVPYRKELTAFLFDSTHDSVKKNLLTPIYKDLKGINAAPSENEEDLISGIIAGATALYDMRPKASKKPTFYLVSRDVLDDISKQDWFKIRLKKSLAGKLLFVCIDIPDNSCSQNPCAETMDVLMEAVATIYRFENN